MAKKKISVELIADLVKSLAAQGYTDADILKFARLLMGVQTTATPVTKAPKTKTKAKQKAPKTKTKAPKNKSAATDNDILAALQKIENEATQLKKEVSEL